jgi:hypothetical protein
MNRGGTVDAGEDAGVDAPSEPKETRVDPAEEKL